MEALDTMDIAADYIMVVFRSYYTTLKMLRSLGIKSEHIMSCSRLSVTLDANLHKKHYLCTKNGKNYQYASLYKCRNKQNLSTVGLS